MEDLRAVLRGEPLGDERAVAGSGVALDAEECRRPVGRQLGDERVEVDLVEDLVQVAGRVLRRELSAAALADAEPVVFGVLDVPELSCRRELLVVRVADAGFPERGFEPLRVRPGVLATANAAPLAYVDEQRDVGLAQRVEEALERPVVDADRRDGTQGASGRCASARTARSRRQPAAR